MSVPYSRYLFGLIPWYSFLIVLGAAIAIAMGIREEKRTDLRKDTFLDFALVVLPAGIAGARIYYVIFSWDQFRNDFLSVFRIWEGGIAIYGAVIAGLAAAALFSARRKISVWTLCDLAAPGLVLAQAIGRWGNYFNQEAYGLALNKATLCFFPFAVQIQGTAGPEWHMATFFYESCWNLCVFAFLMVARRKWFRYRGDVICFYGLLYACGRLIIEDFRMDSLYAASTVRVSQLLSVIICAAVLALYFKRFRKKPSFSRIHVRLPLYAGLAADITAACWLTGIVSPVITIPVRVVLLAAVSAVNIAALMMLYAGCAEGEILYADNNR